MMSWKRSWSWSALLFLRILQSSCCKSELSSSSLSLCSSCVTPQNLFNVVVKFNQIDSLHQPLIECNPVDHLSSGFLSKCELLTALLFWPSTCLFRQLGNFSSWHWTTIGEEVLQSYWTFQKSWVSKTWLCFNLWMVIMSGKTCVYRSGYQGICSAGYQLILNINQVRLKRARGWPHNLKRTLINLNSPLSSTGPQFGWKRWIITDCIRQMIKKCARQNIKSLLRLST